MASPFAVYGPRWEVAVTKDMAAEIGLDAANKGIGRSEWIRQACKEKLEREQQSLRRRRRAS